MAIFSLISGILVIKMHGILSFLIFFGQICFIVAVDYSPNVALNEGIKIYTYKFNLVQFRINAI